MNIEEKTNFHFKMPNSFKEVCLIKLFVLLNSRSYNKMNIYVHEYNSKHLGNSLFSKFGVNEILYFSTKSLSAITEDKQNTIITIENTKFLDNVNKNKGLLEGIGSELNKDLTNLISKVFFKISGISKGYTIVLNLSFIDDFMISEMYYIQALALLISKQEIKDYSKISIILNYENQRLFTSDILDLFIKNILKAIKHLSFSNFIDISKVKEKFKNPDDIRFLHLLANTIYDCDVILDQNIDNTLFRLFKFKTLSTGINKKPLTIGPKKYFKHHHEDFLYI